MGRSVDEIRAELEAAEAAENAAAEEALNAAETANPDAVTVVGFEVAYSDGTVVQFSPVAGDGVTAEAPVSVDEPAINAETSTDNPEGVEQAVTTTEQINPGADAVAVAAAQ